MRKQSVNLLNSDSRTALSRQNHAHNKGVSFSVFLANSILNKFVFIAPEFLLEEVKKHEAKALGFTRFSEEKFEEAYDFLINEITFIPVEEFLRFLPKAKKLLHIAKMLHILPYRLLLTAL